MDRSAQEEREFALPLLLYSLGALNGLDNACPHLNEQISLLSLLNQMLISSRSTLTDTSRYIVLLALQASMRPVSSTHKLNHHSNETRLLFLLTIFLSIQASTQGLPLPTSKFLYWK